MTLEGLSTIARSRFIKLSEIFMLILHSFILKNSFIDSVSLYCSSYPLDFLPLP